MCAFQMDMKNVIQLKILKLCCKNNTKHFKVVCIQFSEKAENAGQKWH